MLEKLIVGLANSIILAAYGRTTFVYFLYFGSLPNVVLPKDINEKMFWRKVFDRNPDFTMFSDKLAVKEYAAQMLPSLATAKVYWYGSDIRTAPDEAFAQPSIFKPNHTSGRFLKLKPGRPDREKLQATAQRWLRYKHYKVQAQWGYKHVKPQLFLEEDVSNAASEELLDMNLYVFGEDVALIIATLGEKTGKDRVGLFDFEGKRLLAHRKSLPLRKRSASLPDDFVLPVDVTGLCRQARKLARGHDHLRVDFMWNGKQLYLCEITVYPGSGFRLYSDPAIAGRMAEQWDLRRSWFLKTEQSGWRKNYAAWLKTKLNCERRTA